MTPWSISENHSEQPLIFGRFWKQWFLWPGYILEASEFSSRMTFDNRDVSLPKWDFLFSMGPPRLQHNGAIGLQSVRFVPGHSIDPCPRIVTLFVLYNSVWAAWGWNRTRFLFYFCQVAVDTKWWVLYKSHGSYLGAVDSQNKWRGYWTHLALWHTLIINHNYVYWLLVLYTPFTAMIDAPLGWYCRSEMLEAMQLTWPGQWSRTKKTFLCYAILDPWTHITWYCICRYTDAMYIIHVCVFISYYFK